ncbi:MAG: N-acetyltransferase [Rickettsiaceae bacterium]|nr:MAG: N-acetyltransferase [Rickettsiaceae bacterium]
MNENNQLYISIKKFQTTDIQVAIADFASDWKILTELFKQYLQRQLSDTQLIWMAYIDDHLAKNLTLKWHSRYKSFAIDNILEIVDLNLLLPFHQIGIGLLLLATTEQQASAKSDIVGISVILCGGCSLAHRLYTKRGYILDRKGGIYNINTEYQEMIIFLVTS